MTWPTPDRRSLRGASLALFVLGASTVGTAGCRGDADALGQRHAALGEEATEDDDPAVVTEAELAAEHPHSPWFRLEARVACPVCGGTYDDQAERDRLAKATRVDLVALDEGAVRPFKLYPEATADEPVPDFWQLTPLRRYRLDVTPPPGEPYEFYSVTFDTGRARQQGSIAASLGPGRRLTRLPGGFRTAADGSLVAFDRERVVRAVAGGPAPFGFEVQPLDASLRGTTDAAFTPSGDLLLRTGAGVQVVDRGTWRLLPGAVPARWVPVFPPAGVRRALTSEGAVLDWSTGTLKVVGQLSLDLSPEPVEPVPFKPWAWSGDGRFVAHSVDGNLIVEPADANVPRPPWDFDGPVPPPGVGLPYLSHDGQTTYYVGHDNLVGCPGNCDLFVNGRRALAGVFAFATSATRSGAVALVRIDQQLSLRVHVPDRANNPGLPQLGGFDVLPSPVADGLVPCSPSAWLETPGQGDRVQPWLSTDEALILQDAEQLVVVDAATGATRATVPGQWACSLQEDGGLVLRSANLPGEGDFSCPTDACRLLTLPPSLDRVDRDLDLYAEGLPLAGARRIFAHPSCGPGGTVFLCTAVVLRGGGGRDLVPFIDLSLTDLYQGSPLRWLDAPCLAVSSAETGVTCAR